MLEKWQCHKCEKGFLLIAEQTKGVSIRCNFCGNAEYVGAVARQNPEVDYENEMGNLYPSYDSASRMTYLLRLGEALVRIGEARESDDHKGSSRSINGKRLVLYGACLVIIQLASLAVFDQRVSMAENMMLWLLLLLLSRE
ncbi:hypothetical protein [Brevibacillus borstelensis]|uniref:hypothetical protein n=1 Tax=Brevibacillus borstelensis TaxID=45462 RepID=UPI00287F8947|nr:hypothetical protein [Brevibacillus borstelensis]WNF07253.1 hypothetical protein RFB14_07445 [Brevibacillus borstelensis]